MATAKQKHQRRVRDYLASHGCGLRKGARSSRRARKYAEQHLAAKDRKR